MSDARIYHHPTCSASRHTLEMIRSSGVEPEVVDYLATPPTREELLKLIADAGLGVRDAMRSKEAVYKELGLDDPGVGDDERVAAMLAHPVLINRPFVVTPLGTRLCRPPESVLDILPRPQRPAVPTQGREPR